MSLLKARSTPHDERGLELTGTCRDNRASILLEQMSGKGGPWLAEISVLRIPSIKER